MQRALAGAGATAEVEVELVGHPDTLSSATLTVFGCTIGGGWAARDAAGRRPASTPSGGASARGPGLGHGGRVP